MSGFRSMPIFECRNDACRLPADRREAEAAVRNPDGRREWNPEVIVRPDPDHPGFDECEAVNGPEDFNCPECGQRGTWVPS